MGEKGFSYGHGGLAESREQNPTELVSVVIGLLHYVGSVVRRPQSTEAISVG